MVVKLFILGLPGSGKSAASHHTEHFARENKWIVKRFRDYGILYKMYLDDVEHEHFRPTKYDGFQVDDYIVLNEALVTLNDRIEKREMLADDSRELLIIEFSRDDYCKALKFLSHSLLKDAYFLFVNADIEICKQRVEERVKKPPEERNEDDNYVPEGIFENYYVEDHRDYLDSVASQMNGQFGIRRENIHVIHNGADVTESAFHKQVTDFAIDTLHLNK